MANELPIAGTQTPQVAPGASQPLSAPFSVPEGYTSDMAKARLAELTTDKEWGARWASGDKRASAEFDALTRHAMGAPQSVPVKEPTDMEKGLAALSAPPDITGYRDSFLNLRGPDGFVLMDEPTRTLVNEEMLPAALALDLAPSDVTMIAAVVANPVSYENCESTLHRLWPGDQFAAGMNDFISVRDSNPKLREMLDRYPETLGNNAMLIASIVAAYRRRGRR